MIAPLRADLAREHGDGLDELLTEWLNVPDAAEVMGTDAGAVRRMLQERQLLAVRRTERNIVMIPAAFCTAEGPLQHLRGTLSVLLDSGFSDVETIRWLFTPDDTLPGSPVQAMQANRKTEVRRRAQALSF